MRVIEQELNIGQDLGLHINGFEDGREVLNEPGHSFVNSFLKALFAKMSAGRVGVDAVQSITTKTSISAIINASPARVRVPVNNYLPWAPAANIEAYVIIANAKHSDGTSYPEMNGTFFATLNYQTTGIYDFNLYLTDKTTPVALTGTYLANSAEVSTWVDWKSPAYTQSNHENVFFNPLLLLGSNTDTTTLMDKAVKGMTAITNNSPVLSVVSYDTVNSQFTLTRTFTNAGSSDILISSVNLVADNYTAQGHNFQTLFARDKFNSLITVAQNKTLTVDYKIKAAMGANGGFVKGFIETLRKLFNNEGYGKNSFFCQAPGGDNYFGRLNSSASAAGYSFGIMVGGVNSGAADATNYAVAPADTGMRNPINHGTGVDGNGNGKLYYGGMPNPAYTENSPAGTSSFTFSRTFENQSGVAVAIKEIGLMGFSYCDNDVVNRALTLLARNDISASPITIQPNEIVRINYKISLTV